MTDATSQPAGPDSYWTSPAFARSLARRYARERRFRLYGMAAIGLALAMLAILLFSIISTGLSAFQQSQMRLEITFSAGDIAPGGDLSEAALLRADYMALARAALRERFPSVSGRTARRQLDGLASRIGLEGALRDMVMADPEVIGTTREIWFPASDDVDSFLKGTVSDVTTRPGPDPAQPTGTQGEVTIFTEGNDFQPVLSEIREEIGRLAELREEDLALARAALAIAEEEAGEAGLTEEETIVRANKVEAAEREVNRLNRLVADLSARAGAVGGSEELWRELPSLLVEINGGTVKAQTVAADRITGTALIALESEARAEPGSWQLVRYLQPETARRLNDAEITWIRDLQRRGELELRFNWTFLTGGASREAELAGLGAALIGSLLTLAVTLVLTFPVGVAAAVYLEEFAPKNRFTDAIEVNINNLAAVPSIVFGLLGLAVFLNFFGLPRSAPLVGGMVLALMSLPTIIIAARAALKAVPPSIRQAALGIGASPLQMVAHHVLPLAMPGILTGTIIAMAQALGETAPLLMIGMVAFIVDLPGGFTDAATVLPVQIYQWASFPERGFVEKTSGAIMILLLFLVAMNAVAVFLRKKFERRW